MFAAGTYDDQFTLCNPILNPDQPIVHEVITKLLQEAELTSAWLPVRKHYLDGWRWLEGNRFYS